MNDLGKFLVIAGLALALLGGALLLAGKIAPDKQWLGRLPGDIRIERDNFKFYFPITTCLLISALLTLIFWLVRRFK